MRCLVFVTLFLGLIGWLLLNSSIEAQRFARANDLDRLVWIITSR